jgi:hypothetical protein
MTQQTDLQAQLDFIERETSAAFALKWIGVGSAIALCLMVASCDSFLPKETPRYNIVAGERRPPAMNAQMLAASAATAQTPAPVPMVQENAPVAPMPTPVPMAMNEPTPVMAPAPVAAPVAAPMPTMQPRKMMPQPALQPMAAAPEPEAPSMLDQMTGVFSSDNEPQSAAMQQPFPTLPPTQTTPPPQTLAPDLESEMAALERDLMAAQTQQPQMVSPAPSPQTMPPLQMQPVSEDMASMPTTLPSDRFRLPPPPNLPSLNNAPMNHAQQPIPTLEPAPEITSVAPATPQPAPALTQPSYIPMAPEVYTNTSHAPAPYGLIPPDLDAQFDDSYLPPMRYTGRRLKRY